MINEHNIIYVYNIGFKKYIYFFEIEKNKNKKRKKEKSIKVRLFHTLHLHNFIIPEKKYISNPKRKKKKIINK
ncbi:hypothetical protein PFUGPA_03286 [Plasmodium falciparum Palo Alto/Uganda]|uniref:Uncharacterized protein n=1 Tax=Plasmodium falciparum (isolate Palo Alto / Uganda) TaxID=57270 RepID=W4IZ87_PLAFP|nr:hypothetical protein PFUGPA_03286 [Plasmodium falciparum Palo Alto/Uganda]